MPPDTMTTTSVELIARYQSLAPLEQTIVRLLCLNIGTMRQDDLLSCLDRLDLRNQKKWYPDRKEIAAALHRLEEAELTCKQKGMAGHQPLLRVHVLLDLLDHNLFATLNDCLTALYRGAKPAWNRFFPSLDHALRILQGQIFDQSISMTGVQETINTIYHEFGHVLDSHPFNTLFGSPLSLSLLRHSPHRQTIGRHFLEDDLNSMQPNPELAVFLFEDFRSAPMTGSPLTLILYLLVTGKMDQAMELVNLSWPDHFSTSRKCGLATIHFLQGQYQTANYLFAEALVEVKKITGKRKIVIFGLPGIFHLYSLLAIPGMQNLKTGTDLVETAHKQELLPDGITSNLKIVFAQQEGQPHGEGYWDKNNLSQYPLHQFLYFLSLWWADRKKAYQVLPKLCEPLYLNAIKNGYPWIAAECAALLAAMGRETSNNKKLADDLHKRCRTTSCVPIVQPKDKNTQRLQALLALIAKDSLSGNASAPNGQRLIWMFSYYPSKNYCILAPVLQKMGKTGKWSKGRGVALKTLYEQFEKMEGLSDQDRRMCRTLIYNRQYYYYEDAYQFDMKKTLVAAIDHPLLFLADTPGVQVELMRGELELRITQKDDKLTLALWPTPPAAATTAFLQRENTTSFKVYEIKPAQANLVTLLNEELVLPVSATEQVRELASSLSTMVTVHSDVGGGQEVEEVDSDPRPHLQLLPFQEGLRAEILVRPISTGGSWLQPGQGGAIVFGEQEGKRVQARRDLAKESDQRDQLLGACPIMTHTEEVDGQFFFPDPATSLELLCQLRQFPDCTLHWPKGQTFSLRAETGFSNLSLRIKKDRDWFAASGSLQVDGETVLDLQKLLGLLDQANGRFIPLEDGSFLALTKALQKRLEEFRTYSEKGKDGIRFNPLAALALDDLTSEASVDGDQQWQAHKNRLAEVVQPPVPSTLTATLRDYQRQGFSWLAQLSHWQMGACLADDMGLGKTIQALAAILLRASKGPTLVVAPLSVAGNWQEEAGRFAPTLQVKIFGQGDRQEMLAVLGPFDLLISSYGLLQVDGERLAGVAWQTVVLDEAQAIKNRQTKRAKAAMALNAEFRIITTGTPLENHLGELWALFHFINPGLLGTHQRFTENFAIPIERDKDRNRLQQLQRLIHPFILRRMKNEVLQELPAKTEITLQVEMSAQEATLYEAQRRTALAKLESDGNGQGETQHLQILAEIMKLRRLCCNPALVLPEAGIASSKLKVFGDILAEMLENRHKALVFSQFIDHLAIIRTLLNEKKIPYQYLDGSTSAAQRKERIAAFQSGMGEVFLISLKAGGSGLNLTAADYVIHMDPWWNPAVEDQASDRAHRIGQERPVTVYRLVMKNSIEEQIISLHKDKRDLADSLLDGADVAGKLNAGELLALLRDSGRGDGK
ncbi:MAG: DEAD/DEAH box helicase [Deltaproteobacteria bacterium]|nr:DEAD/DEAH box helicase [Deltaproteobacteria bacterium]